MKTNDLFPSQKQILTEGLKFGNKEIRQVEKESRDIILGIEYEYHVDEDIAVGSGSEMSEEMSDAIYDIAADKIQEDINEKKEQMMDDYADGQMDEYNVGDGTSNLNQIKKFVGSFSDHMDVIVGIESDFESVMMNYDEDEPYDENDGRVIKDYISAMENLPIDDLERSLNSLEANGQLEDWIHYIGDSDIASNLDNVKHELQLFVEWRYALINVVSNHIESGTDYHSDIYDEFNANFYMFEMIYDYLEMIGSLIGDDSDWDEQIKEEYKSHGEEHWEEAAEHYLGYNPDEVFESPFWEEARNQVEESGDYSTGDIPAAIEENINEYFPEISDDIERYDTDGTVDNGAETVTKPLPLNRALEVMETMFEHIHEVGSTSMQTGMHVNMSIRGLSFTKDNFNPTKLTLLLDPNLLYEFFNRRRTYTDPMFDEMTADFMVDIAEITDSKDLIKFFELHVVNRGKKHLQINFSNIADSVKESRRSIEFRYFGGTDYEDRFDTIKWNIYRTAYVLMVAYSEEFGNKEYLKALYKLLDSKSEELYGFGFAQLQRLRKKYDRSYIQQLLKI